jgi:CheY-like chemotaxis protein
MLSLGLEQPVKTILVIADDPSKLAALSMILRSLGYFVLEAGDGDEAIRQYEAHPRPIELVTADVPSDGGSFAAWTEYLEAVNPSLPTLFLSDSPEQLAADSSFVRKPFSIDVLAKALTNLLGAIRQDSLLRAR